MSILAVKWINMDKRQVMNYGHRTMSQ